jgi:hypothetical protein
LQRDESGAIEGPQVVSAVDPHALIATDLLHDGGVDVGDGQTLAFDDVGDTTPERVENR